MKNLIFLLLILMFPLSLCAKKDSTVKQKVYVINQTEKHTRLAKENLKAADEMRILIPNLEDRLHMHTLITTAIGSMGTSDIKTRIVIVGVALIGSLATNLYDNYVEYRTLLTRAEHHLEMLKFYSKISDKLTDRMSDDADYAFCMALDYITIGCKHVFVLENEIYPGGDSMRHAVSNELKKIRKEMTDEFLNNTKGLTDGSIDACEGIFDNIYEVVSEVEDEFLRNEIYYCLREASKYLELAKKLWQEANKKSTPVYITG